MESLTNSRIISCRLSKKIFFLNANSSYSPFLSSAFSILKSSKLIWGGLLATNSLNFSVNCGFLIDLSFAMYSYSLLFLIISASFLNSSHSSSLLSISDIRLMYLYFYSAFLELLPVGSKKPEDPVICRISVGFSRLKYT